MTITIKITVDMTISLLLSGAIVLNYIHHKSSKSDLR